MATHRRRGSLEDSEDEENPHTSRYNTSSLNPPPPLCNNIDTVQNTANTCLIHIINMEGRLNKLEKEINELRKDNKQMLMILKTISIVSSSSGVKLQDSRKPSSQ